MQAAAPSTSEPCLKTLDLRYYSRDDEAFQNHIRDWRFWKISCTYFGILSALQLMYPPAFKLCRPAFELAV